MELRSYDESYLPHAMNLMSSMLECAVDYFHQDADRFFHLFLLSPMCGQFESGDPALLQDHTGLELCCMALGKLDPPSYVPSIEEHTPLSWAVRSLTYCQWYMNRTFCEIVLCAPLSDILSWYSDLHDKSTEEFIHAVAARLRKRPTNLELFRRREGLSQRQLSVRTGVSLRSIQLYEQRQNDLYKAQYNTLSALAKIFHCTSDDLMDSNTLPYYESEPHSDPFMQKFYESALTNNVKGCILHDHNDRLERQILSLKQGYLSQLSTHGQIVGDKYHTTPAAFMENWLAYWTPVISHRLIQNIGLERVLDLFERIANEAVEKSLPHTSTPRPSPPVNMLCMISAETLYTAVASAVEAVKLMK